MSNPARVYKYKENSYTYPYETVELPLKKAKRRYKKNKRKNPVVILFFFILATLYSYYVCPFMYTKFFEPLVLNRFLNRDFHPDVSSFMYPSQNYLHNSYFLDRYILVSPNYKSKQMTDIKIIGELTSTKEKILNLAKNYPELTPAVFVWDYEEGKGFEINSNEVFPSASIIKIPIAFELIRLIEQSTNTNNPIRLNDKRTYTEFFKTGGSGNLQKTQTNVDYSLDYLANIMIANSDNSATNMILYEIGGINGFNRAMRNLGLKVTSMSEWLPDLEGTNKITAYEISKILYNVDNPNYIDTRYKNVLKEYLGNTRNTHLLKEKLPESAMVLHKTGNIASMLGDSGIVYTDNGKKYIVTILAKRPANSYRAKLFIQDASLIIYNDIKALP